MGKVSQKKKSLEKMDDWMDGPFQKIIKWVKTANHGGMHYHSSYGENTNKKKKTHQKKCVLNIK